MRAGGRGAGALRHSIKRQLAVVFIAVMTGLIFACWLANSLFLEKYYISNKGKSMMEAYMVVNRAVGEEDIYSDAFQRKLEGVLSANNISILVLDQGYNTVITSVNESNVLSARLIENIYDVNRGDRDILEEYRNFTLSRTRDRFYQKDYLELFGTLDNGDLFLLRSPVEGIRENVSLSNRFMAYIGICAVIIGTVIIGYLSKKITDPILEIARISQRMSQMEFDIRYRGKEKNELGILGESINEMADRLEQTIAELKTANNELQKDIEQKTKIDEMRKEFVANVSHELKTPIALIQGYAEGLQECINDDAQSRDFYCEVIIDEAGKMNRMVKKLLTLNKLEFGAQTMEIERFDIVSVITGIVHASDILMQQKGVKLALLAKEPVYVWADEFDIEEVFGNYFSNALNHVEGEMRIEVRVERAGDTVRVSVYNTGQQIPEEDLDKIWIKFYKVDKARTREYGGSGIGLSIVKAVMDALHQKYGVRNREDGVEFWFELDGGNGVKSRGAEEEEPGQAGLPETAGEA